MTEKLFLSPKEAAEFLGISCRTIYAWIQYKRVPFRKHGRLVKFHRQDLIDWSNSQKIQPYYTNTSKKEESYGTKGVPRI